MLSILSIWFGMLFFGGARLRHLGIVAAVGLAVFCGAWNRKILKPHQKMRLAVFLDRHPSKEAMRAGGYQIEQSQIAIGAGEITGQGFGRGMQNRSRFVPESTTDFVFTVVAEELGFVGSASLILLYLMLLLRSAATAMATDNYFGVLIGGGFTALIAFHTIVNLGMTMRVMPITGVPLPFFSYGGSSFIAFSMCVGLLQSIAVRRRRASL
jgi:rod shape determining protein RodA